MEALRLALRELFGRMTIKECSSAPARPSSHLEVDVLETLLRHRNLACWA